jgi:hypothetical protein
MGPLVPGWLEQTLGVFLALLILSDVFLVILYARIGAGFLSDRVARWVWLIFRFLSQPFDAQRGRILAFCGPAILVAVVGVWALALTGATGLIIHPKLGTSVTSTVGPTPTDFISAMYAGGSSMSLVGVSDFVPQTRAFQFFYLLTSLVGLSVLSLSLMYLLEVYTALYRRNTLGYQIHLVSGETADAAELLAGLGAEGRFSEGYTILAQLAADVTGVKESHHFYPVLFYFRFRDPSYSVSRISLVSLDTVTLIKSGLDDDYAWLKESAAVTQLWRGCMILMTRLAETFLRDDLPDPTQQPDEATNDLWRRRYFAGLRRLRQAGIRTIPDEESGAADYVRLRATWHPHIRILAPALAYVPEEIDPVGSDPESSDRRAEFRLRRRAAG